jgi:3-hydroxyisobutyrate dehydrogenase-like beta-hydroxyacid dehydrogenase
MGSCAWEGIMSDDTVLATSLSPTAVRDDAPLPGVSSLRIALIGFGEVGGIFGAALVKRGVAQVTAYDVLLGDASRASELRMRADAVGVRIADSAAAATNHAHLVISAVTASATRAAAEAIARAMKPGTFLLDINSASPRIKMECGAHVEAALGRYVESAVMTSVPPYGIRVPMLLGGPHAAALAPTLAALGFDANVASGRYGVASAIKMCRSVIVKGMEAIVIESFVTARRYGVEDAVLASLGETFPGLDWEKSGDYFFSRVVRHGKRRAEEMREAAATVREAGLEPLCASAIAQRQQSVADLAASGTFAGMRTDDRWRALADAIDKSCPP